MTIKTRRGLFGIPSGCQDQPRWAINYRRSHLFPPQPAPLHHHRQLFSHATDHSRGSRAHTHTHTHTRTRPATHNQGVCPMPHPSRESFKNQSSAQRISHQVSLGSYIMKTKTVRPAQHNTTISYVKCQVVARFFSPMNVSEKKKY